MSTRQPRHPSNRGVLQCHTREFQRTALALAALSASAHTRQRASSTMSGRFAWMALPDSRLETCTFTCTFNESRPRDYRIGRRHGIT